MQLIDKLKVYIDNNITNYSNNYDYFDKHNNSYHMNKLRLGYDIPLLIIIILIFLLTTFFLEKNQHCNMAIHEIIGNSSLTTIKYLFILASVSLVYKLTKIF
jgi:hypothetical protein